ncbi:MAG: DEAD/DEAH box helicase, partial [Thermodesulfobacteriota bacterium]
MTEPIDRYRNLSAPEQLIVQTLTVAMDPLDAAAIAGILAHLPPAFTKGADLSRAGVKKQLAALARANLVYPETKTKLACTNLYRQAALADALGNGLFAAVCQELLRQQPVQLNGWRPFGTYPRYLRLLRYRLFEGAEMQEIDQLSRLASREFLDLAELSAALCALFTPFDGRILSHFPPASQQLVLAHLLQAASLALAPAGKLFDFLRTARWGERQADADALLALYLTQWGCLREGRARYSALPEEQRASQPQLSGWQLALAGNDREAIPAFAGGLKSFLKRIGKRKYFFEDLAGIFFLLALIRSGEPDHLREARRHIKMLEGLRHHPLHRYSPTLQDILALATGTPAEEVAPQRTPRRGLPKELARMILARQRQKRGAQNPIGTLLTILVDYWQRPDKCRGLWEQDLARLHRQATAAGHVWLAMESAELLARLGADPARYRKKAEELRKEHDLASIADVIRLVAPWERRLRALLNLPEVQKDSAAPGAGSRVREQRLIWLLGWNKGDDSWQLTPRLQVRNKSGAWSAGRTMALERLAGGGEDAGLTDQDRAVCATIERDIYGYRQSWRFRVPDTLTALVGHPLLFQEDGSGRIDLVRGEPELLVTRGRNGVEIRLSPTPGPDETTWTLVRETPTRIKLFVFTPRHLEVAKILAEGIKAPPEAEALAAQAAAALAPLLTVHSDLAGTGGRECVADPTPHLHLLPHGDGLKAELLVRPLAGAELWRRPGKGERKVFAEVEGEKCFAERDLQEEKRRAVELIESCPTFTGGEEEDAVFLLPDPESCLDFLVELRELGDRVVISWPKGERFRLRGRADTAQLSLNIRKDREWFKASGSLALDDGSILPLQQLLALLEQPGERFVRLDDGSFLALTNAFRSRLDALRACGERRGDGVRLSPLAALAMADGEEFAAIDGDRHWQANLDRFRETVAPELPSTLQAELRDYQAAGFRWLAQLAHWGVGACLADDMGLGKTIQALAAILTLAPEGPTLVVAPLSVLMNWQEEARRFAPTLNVLLFGSGDRQQTLDGLRPFDLVICSYGLLQSEAERLAKVDWRTVVLDEAQAIKNMHTKRSQAAKGLTGRFRLITTGTPVENHLGELWNLFDFLNPGLLGSFPHFSRTFMTATSSGQDRKTRVRLKKLIQPFLLRRLKSQVLQELPSRTEITLRVEMSGEEAALYEAQRRLALEKIEGDATADQQKRFRILAEIMRLRRLCCNPALVLPDCSIPSSKLKVFGDLVDDIRDNRHKALVFSQFVDHLAIISRFLDERNIPYQYLDGSTPAAARRKRINAFQAGEGDVFLISLKAGGSGLNLTAADYVIHMDPWWNPAVEDQASDRAHRIGQTRPVTIYRLVMAETIEEQIIKL